MFRAKAAGLRLRRAVADISDGPRRLARCDTSDLGLTLAVSRTPLLSDPRPEEAAFQAGKVENLRQAAARLDGTVIPAGQVFSFWRQLGPATRARGFVVGRMLQGGCLVAAVGGGLCQLSNALFEAALASGCEIVERHAHSRRVPGSAAALGRDATVAWNYVDFRFRARRDLVLSVTVEPDDLVVALTGRRADGPPEPGSAPAAAPVAEARSCATCDETDCHRHEG